MLTLRQLLARLAKAVVLFTMVFPVLSAYAGDAVMQTSNRYSDASDFIVNIAAQVPYLMQLVTAIAYVMGMYLIIAGVMKLKHLGESRTMMSQEHSVKGPLVLLTVGALLLYLPSAVNTGLSTFWTEPNPYAYVDVQEQWATFIKACFVVIQLVGTIAFIRGLVILSQLGHQSHQQGVFAKGLTHIIGGILCINLYQFVQAVMTILGFDIFS
jgi:intracellular multiplication protein IcmC